MICVLFGKVLTPWPCFVVVAAGTTLRDPEKRKALLRMMKVVRRVAGEFKHGTAIPSSSSSSSSSSPSLSSQSTVEYLMEHHQQNEADAKTWLSHTRWVCQPSISQYSLHKVTRTLVNLGVLLDKEIPDNLTRAVCAQCITTVRLSDDEGTEAGVEEADEALGKKKEEGWRRQPQGGGGGGGGEGWLQFLPEQSILRRSLA